MRQRLLVIASHPIQYHAPYFSALALCPELDVDVLFAEIPDAVEQGRGFGVAFQWDTPLVEGYRSSVMSSPHMLVAQLRNLDPDCALVMGWHHASLIRAALALRLLNVPTLVRGESNNLRVRPVAVRELHRVFLRLFSGYLTIGKANAAFYRQYGIADERIHTANYCVDNEFFAMRTSAIAREAARSQFRLIPERFTFLFAGKLETKKRILDVIHALHRVRSALGVPCQLLVAGDGVLRDGAMELARQYELPARFVGFLNQTEMPAAYAASDCLVLPSDYGETWGLVVNEAMACGRPAIVSDRVGCGPDLIMEGETGAVVRYADIEHLSGTMARYASRPEAAASMGARARDHLERGYTIGAAVAGTLKAVRARCTARR